jgi:hypothetical protein
MLKTPCGVSKERLFYLGENIMYTSIIFIVMMTVMGFVIFDNIAVSAAFGIGTGSIFGIIFSDKKSKKEECGKTN